jgi:hypothetical protein
VVVSAPLDVNPESLGRCRATIQEPVSYLFMSISTKLFVLWKVAGAELERRVQAQLRRKGILTTAKELGVGTGTMQRIARECGLIALSMASARPAQRRVASF